MPVAERLAWTPAAWEDYFYWQGQDRKQIKRINLLIQACLRDGPRPSKGRSSGGCRRP